MARKRTSFQSKDFKRDIRHRLLIIGGGLIGLVVCGALGYLFGFFVIPNTDAKKQFGDSATVSGAFFLWAFAIGGLLIGARIGEGMYRAHRKREQSRQRRERYKDHLEKFEQEQAALAGKDDGYTGNRMKSSRRLADERGYESPWP